MVSNAVSNSCCMAIRKGSNLVDIARFVIIAIVFWNKEADRII